MESIGRKGADRLRMGWYGLLWLLALMAASPLRAEMSPAVAAGQGILWEVSRPGVAPSYVFGTMHVSDKTVTTLAQPVQKAFDASRLLFTELEMNFATIATVLRNMYYDDDRTLADILPPDLLEKTLKRVKCTLGYSRKAALNLRPWAVMSLLGARRNALAHGPRIEQGIQG